MRLHRKLSAAAPLSPYAAAKQRAAKKAELKGPQPPSPPLAEAGLNGPATLLAPPSPVQSSAPVEALTNADPAVSAAVGAAVTAAVLLNSEAITRVAFDDVTYFQSAAITPPGGDQANASLVGQIPFRYATKAGTPPRIRTGYYYLPSGWVNTTLPVMVLMHGLAGYGESILNAGSQGTFQDQAEQFKFIVVAPDSRTADFSGWSVPSAEEPPSQDMLHTQACLQYVLSLPNVRWDPKYVVAAGVSNGGAIVAPLASRYSIYTHAMIFHARFFGTQLQSNKVPIWISTGVRDNEYPPTSVEAFAQYFEQAFPDWPPITYNVDYQVGHTLEDPLERSDAFNWWLGRGSWTEFTPGYQISAWANAADLLPSPPTLPNAGPPVK